MRGINIDKMSLKDLIDLELKVKKAIGAAKERERSQLKQKIEQLVQSSGFSIDELFARGRASMKGRTVAPKFANPENKSETWSGRGRKPKWLVAKLGKGAKMQDFAI
ncbi:MAG TPA: H-NS histone family protein [Hyphomicrobiaceae bacterium]|nr:H-NS histone family protein [Hyphomicrobiaceae bacterium]